MTPEQRLAGALSRATVALAGLDTSRRPADVERVVCAIRHELRTALQCVGLDPEQVLTEGAVVAPALPPVEDALPFDSITGASG